MDRIAHSSHVDIGGGRRGFRSKDTVAGVPGTVVTATHLNATQEEQVRFIEKSGLAPNPNDLEQTARGVRRQRLNYFDAPGGSANALTIVMDPVPADYAEIKGAPIRIKAAATNTAAMTLAIVDVAGPARAITYSDGAAIRSGDIVAGSIFEVEDDGTRFLVTAMPAAAIKRAILKRSRVFFTTTGSFSYTVPAGVYSLIIKAWGAGGGGGYGASQGGASGGGSGGYFELEVDVTPGQVITGVIAAGGLAGFAGSNGLGGGNTTVTVAGVTYSAIGGNGGQNANSGSVGNSQSGGSTAGAVTVSKFGEPSGGGLLGYSGSGILAYGGRGGTAPGGGYGGNSGSGNANNGSAPGGGGGGSANGGTAGAGSRGEVVIEFVQT